MGRLVVLSERAVVVTALVLSGVGAAAAARFDSATGDGGRANDRLVVEVQGARVEVQRDPIRLTFTNDAGEPVLMQSPRTGSGVLAVPETIDPRGAGEENPDAPRLHAPFPFLVGTEELTQYRYDPFQGISSKGSVLASSTRQRASPRPSVSAMSCA